MTDLKKKTLMLIVSVVLLISTVMYLSFAWYTKMTSVADLTFRTAKWDISANYQISDFSVNVFEYSTIGSDRLAAPGVWGFIPIEITAKNANTDVAFTLTVDKTTMSTEFQERLYFYYLPVEDGEEPEYPEALPEDLSELIPLVAYGVSPTKIEGTVIYNGSTVDPEANDGTATVIVYWHWIYDYDEWLEINDEDLLDVVTVLNSLYHDNPENMNVLYNSQTSVIALAPTSEPAEQYYYYDNTSPYYQLITNEEWQAMGAVRPMNMFVNHGTAEEPNFVEETIPNGTTELVGKYYIETSYHPYTGSETVSHYYTKNGNTYQETTFRFKNQLFTRTNSTNHQTEYYALTIEQMDLLAGYRDNSVTNKNSSYFNRFDDFFRLLYTNYTTAVSDFDIYDTKVGLNPTLYVSQMAATVILTGEEVVPQKMDPPSP